MIAVVGISGVLLLGGVYSALANTSGYDMYKEALKKTHQLDSTTMNMSLALEDSSKELYRMDSVVKTNRIENLIEMESTETNGIDQMSYEMAKQDGGFFVHKEDENKVYVMESKGYHHDSDLEGNESKVFRKELELLVDVLTKKYQKKITVEDNQDGTYLIDLELSNSELPSVTDAFTSFMYKHAVRLNQRTTDSESNFHSVKPELPDLKEDILIEEIKVSAKISAGNYVEEQFMSAIISGKNPAGAAEKLQISFKLDLTNVNETNVTPMDVSGLELVEFEHGHGK